MRSRLWFRLIIATVATLIAWLFLSFLGNNLLAVEAASLSKVLSVIGVGHIRIGRTIYVSHNGEIIGFRIEWHCSGTLSYTIFLIASILIPLNISRKLIWLFQGFLILYLVNIMRMIIIIIVFNNWGVKAATWIHTVAGSLLLLGTVILLVTAEFLESMKSWRRFDEAKPGAN